MEFENSNVVETSYDAYKHAYSIIESCNAVVFEWSLNNENATKFVTENIRIFGYVPEDFYTGEHSDYWNFIHHNDRESVRTRVYQARCNEMDTFSHSYRVITKKGEIRWVREQMNLIKDDQGELITERGVLVDITDVKELEKRIEEKENRYRKLFENSPMMIFILDSQGCVQEVNRQVTSELGYKSNELLGLNINDVLGIDVLVQVVGTDEFESFEIKTTARSGQLKYLQLYVNRLESSQVKGYELVGRDITTERIENERIKYFSYHDKKTGMFNRTYFDEILEMLNTQRNARFSIIIGDLNGLKDINSLYGYKVGDAMLKKVAEIICKLAPADSVVARIGGDEFGIVLPNYDHNQSRMLCKLIRQDCELADEFTVKPSIALGYSTSDGDSISTTQLIQIADKRMSKNKLTVSKGESSGIIQCLEASLREKTFETEEHAHRLQNISLKLGEALEFTDSMLDDIAVSTLMHDIGKVGIPDSILIKEGPLNETEWETMKSHCEIGFKILNTSNSTKEIGKYVLHHHERWDGNGYPQGLKGEEIPIISRIITIVDSYDVMVNDRPYKKAISREEAILELENCAGTQFDPDLVQAFIKILD